MMKLALKCAARLFFAASLFSLGVAHATPVAAWSVTALVNKDGVNPALWDYAYVVSNTAAGCSGYSCPDALAKFEEQLFSDANEVISLGANMGATQAGGQDIWTMNAGFALQSGQGAVLRFSSPYAPISGFELTGVTVDGTELSASVAGPGSPLAQDAFPVSSVPEPSSVMLVVLGLAGMSHVVRRRRA